MRLLQDSRLSQGGPRLVPAEARFPGGVLTFRPILKLFAMLGMLVLAVPLVARAYDYSYARVVRLSLVQGDVQVSRPNGHGWENASINMPMQQGFTISTNEGRAEIEFENGTAARMAEKTVLQFTDLALSDGGRITKLTITQGTASFYTRLAGHDSFTVLTPQVKVNLPNKHSDFRLDVFADGSSVSLFKGSASVVSSSAGTKDLHAGETLAFSANQFRIEPSPPQDAWDQWVKKRQNTVVSATDETQAYANAPFDYGLSDLSTYGAWNYYPGYGNCWQPWGVGPGWAPFYDGAWGFYPGLGWTWIGAEPWGWVPYHFGQWEFSPLYGWFWVPGFYQFWNPAPVEWIVVGNQIGWTPIRALHPIRTNANHPVIVGGTKLGQLGPKQIFDADNLPPKIRILPVPPLPNGKIPSHIERVPADQAKAGMAANALASAPKSAFRGEPSAVVPTSAGLAALSAITFDALEHRFLNGIAPGDQQPVRITSNAAPHTSPVPVPPRIIIESSRNPENMHHQENPANRVIVNPQPAPQRPSRPPVEVPPPPPLRPHMSEPHVFTPPPPPPPPPHHGP